MAFASEVITHSAPTMRSAQPRRPALHVVSCLVCATSALTCPLPERLPRTPIPCVAGLILPHWTKDFTSSHRASRDLCKIANLALSMTREQKNPHPPPNKVIYVAMKGARGGEGEAPTASLYTRATMTHNFSFILPIHSSTLYYPLQYSLRSLVRHEGYNPSVHSFVVSCFCCFL